MSERWRISGQYSYLDTSARTAFEQGLHGRHAGSLALTHQPAPAHQLTAAYYGNSAISGLSYGRYDLVYAHRRAFKQWQWRSQRKPSSHDTTACSDRNWHRHLSWV